MNANKLFANILKYIEARRNLLIALLKFIMLDAYKQLLSTILAFYVNTGYSSVLSNILTRSTTCSIFTCSGLNDKYRYISLLTLPQPHIPWQDEILIEIRLFSLHYCLLSEAEGTEKDFNIPGVASSRRMQETFHQHKSGKRWENNLKLNKKKMMKHNNITIYCGLYLYILSFSL